MTHYSKAGRLFLLCFALLFSQQVLADIHSQLLIAVKKDKHSLVKKLLKKGAFVDVLDEKYGTALYIAAARGNLKIVKLLLDAGADINRGYADGETPVMVALFNQKWQVFDWLLSKTPKLDVTTRHGSSLLMYAGAFGNMELMKRLLLAGLKVNQLDADGDGVLHYCVGSKQGKQNCTFKMFKLLLASGADITLKSRRTVTRNGSIERKNFSVFEYAAQFGRVKIVKYLMENKSVKVLHCNQFGHNALQQAIVFDQVKVVRYLLKEYRPFLLQDCVFNAVARHSKKEVSKSYQWIVSKSYFLSLPLVRKNKLLTSAVLSGKESYIRYLLKIGGLNRKSFDQLKLALKKRVINLVLTSNSTDLLADMVSRGIINSKTKIDGQLLIRLANKKNRELAYTYLIAIGFIPSKGELGEYIRRLVFKRDRHSQRPSKIKVLTNIAKAGASAYIDVSTGDTFLTLLYKYKDISLAKYIINKHKNYINKPNNDGYTPLMLASKHGNLPLLALLLRNGAKVNLINNKGKSALTIAIDAGKSKIAETLLLKKGVNWKNKVLLSKTNTKVSLLVYAASKRQMNIVRMLLRRTHKLPALEASQLIYFSIKYNKRSLLKTLLETKYSLNIVAKPFTSQQYAIDVAIHYNRVAIVNILLSKKAKFYSPKKNISYLMKLVQDGKSRMLKIFLSRGVDINQNYPVDYRGRVGRMSFLNYSLDHRRIRLAKILLEQKADPNVWDDKGRTAIFYAKGEYITRQLVAAGANINHEDKFGQTALSRAVEKSEIKLIKLLIKKGANPTIGYSQSGATQLMVAIWNEKPVIVRLLLLAGADPSSAAVNTRLKLQNAFEVAKQINHKEITKLLMRKHK
ncbi:hypothetical protein MNBD_GAMMA12-1264 [hydrothermal vent metagenome]|uniref:Uncharacterized protein n=1 Tax=hydrothermal vent metagenome TaxID=652676 RepID=A0A3B0Y2J9_9ZZZZ